MLPETESKLQYQLNIWFKRKILSGKLYIQVDISANMLKFMRML